MAGHQCQGRGLQCPANPLQASPKRYCLMVQLVGRGSHLMDQHPACQDLGAASLRGIHVQADWGRWNDWRLHPVPEKPVPQSSLISRRQQSPKLGISIPDTHRRSRYQQRAGRYRGESRCGRGRGPPRSVGDLKLAYGLAQPHINGMRRHTELARDVLAGHVLENEAQAVALRIGQQRHTRVARAIRVLPCCHNRTQ